MAHILIIDDDKAVCKTLSAFVKSMGHKATSAYRLRSGLEQVSKNIFELIFLDINLPDGDGLNAIAKIKSMPNPPEIVIITGAGNSNCAKIAIESGAWDYIQKPFGMDDIRLLVTRILQYRKEKSYNNKMLFIKRSGIIGTSPEVTHCLDLVAKAAATEANVLITGETGTGKELFAKAIHENSSRRKKPFVVVDCAALTETLIESELFGYEKGAFTGANQARAGLIKEADGGTLFLDEVGELPISQQKAFLRVLQENCFRRVGGKKVIDSDFRLISATNRDVEKLIEAGTFRKDLLFRLRTLTIQLPPLRARSVDIYEILMHYLQLLGRKYNSGQKGFSPEFFESIMQYSWPGNVRELIHAVESALSVSRDEPTLFRIHLPNHIRSQLAKTSVGKADGKRNDYDEGHKSSPTIPTLKELIESTEKQYFDGLIKNTGGDIKEISRISGLSRSKVYDRFKKYGLSKCQ